jgi:phospholipid-binding lipoprotein MlaA
MGVRPRAPRRALTAIVFVVALGGCAAPAGVTEWDPWEGFNRKMFWFNERLDQYVLEPTAEGWVAITDPGFRDSIQNFVSNLAFPMNFINNVLEFRLGDAARITARFVVNTTIGMLGFFDPATQWGLTAAPANFGQTLAVWGLEEGPYLVIPFLGPSTPRDATGLVADFYVASLILPSSGAFIAVYVVSTVNWRGINLDNISEAREASLDYYAAVRSAWLDSRRRAIGVMLPAQKRPTDQEPVEEEDPYDVESAINP